MGINIQCYSNIRMPHQILQGFRIHPGSCTIAAVCMPAYMWCHFGHLHTINLIVFLNDMLKIFFPVQCYHRHSVFIQIKKSCLSCCNVIASLVTESFTMTVVHWNSKGFFNSRLSSTAIWNAGLSTPRME